ncbi:molybdopterin-dependent oxidoreductase [Pandoraea sp. XJJ-1]|uniref:molybdopterin-dependent oxidoreductase n=1 Tax=Pandoraea sp. XJJ-1 TaxID=3002643 RepID=UPI002281D79C|nr:molybdopterin-dependent oxidoreductase [Pandoraea sp. XJJ-1]WAL84102.1 molybdopterin-dependent oxidoreductase [Pandoraea sp. XJJ-1]
MVQEVKPGFCTLCRSRCGTLARVENDALIAVEPDPSHPNGAAMCRKGKAAPELVHHPDRLTTPLRRTTPKGADDPGWTPISWDEALTEIAARLGDIRRESGAHAVAFGVTTPSGTPLSDSIDWIERFIRVFGGPNTIYATEICNWHKDFAHAFTFGCGMPTADYAQADVIMVWGHNPTSTWLSQANAIGRGRARGAKLLVVDPRKTPLAADADAWLPVRPGTDAALALGLARRLIDSGRYDEMFVRRWTNAPLLVRNDNGHFLRVRDVAATHVGVSPEAFVIWNEAAAAPQPYETTHALSRDAANQAALRGEFAVMSGDGSRIACRPAFDHLCAGLAAYDAATVSALCGVSPAQLDAAADLFTGAQRVAYHAWSGVAQHANATQIERAIAVLYALTGSFDRRGGNRVMTRQPLNAVSQHDLLSPEQQARALGLDARPLGPPARGWVTARDTYRAILDGTPYRVRALFCFGTNVLASQADYAMAREALEALEFHVHCDLFETPSARFADIVLPVNTPWEREGLRAGFEIDDRADALIQLRQRMVSPRGESRSDNDIVFDLAVRLGMGDAFFGGSLDAGWNHQLAPLGLDVQTLRAHPEGISRPQPQYERKYARTEAGDVRGFATETRRVELYSEHLLRHGYPPVPAHVAPRAVSDDEALRFPLLLGSTKNGYYCHSQHRGLASLRMRAPDPVVHLHPTLAARRHIAEGDWVRVTTPAGVARFRAAFDAGLGLDVLLAEYGWWQACDSVGRDGFAMAGDQSSNFNALVTTQDIDPISGASPLRSFRCDVARDPASNPARRPWDGMARFRIAALDAAAEGVCAIALDPLDDVGLPDYLPGQHVTVRVSIPGQGQPVTRAYSLTGPSSERDRRGYRIAVRHQQGRTSEGTPFDGLVSSWLNTGARVGDVIELGAPSGRFVMPLRSRQPVVCFAGGIGITPFLCYLESLAEQAERAPLPLPDVWLHYANRNGATHAFRDRLAALAQRLSNVRVFNYYDAPREADVLGRDYASAERLSAAVVSDDLIKRRARFYLCGPAPMMTAVMAGLAARGVPAFDMFKEAFRSPSAPRVDAGAAWPVTFARSGREAVWMPSHGSLLSFAESLGLALPSGCRVGQCESCAVRVLAGEVEHLGDVALDEPGMCLACQAVPREAIVLDA